MKKTMEMMITKTGDAVVTRDAGNVATDANVPSDAGNGATDANVTRDAGNGAEDADLDADGRDVHGMMHWDDLPDPDAAGDDKPAKRRRVKGKQSQKPRVAG